MRVRVKEETPREERGEKRGEVEKGEKERKGSHSPVGVFFFFVWFREFFFFY